MNTMTILVLRNETDQKVRGTRMIAAPTLTMTGDANKGDEIPTLMIQTCPMAEILAEGHQGLPIRDPQCPILEQMLPMGRGKIKQAVVGGRPPSRAYS